MSNELTTQQAFQEHIKGRLREDVGKLMPDDMLAKLIEQAIKEMFFTRRVDRSSYRDRDLPSWFEDEVAKLLAAGVKTQIQAWLDANDSVLREQVTAAIREQLPHILCSALFAGFTAASTYQGQSWLSDFTERLRSVGVSV